MGEETTKGFWQDAEIIYAYKRAQAIEDGVLVDFSSVAREAGIKFPVAMTSAVWGKYIEVPEGDNCQDETGRTRTFARNLYLFMAFAGQQDDVSGTCIADGERDGFAAVGDRQAGRDPGKDPLSLLLE